MRRHYSKIGRSKIYKLLGLRLRLTSRWLLKRTYLFIYLVVCFCSEHLLGSLTTEIVLKMEACKGT
jgi:hypothetical protein